VAFGQTLLAVARVILVLFRRKAVFLRFKEQDDVPEWMRRGEH
jgi:hypothetical protein